MFATECVLFVMKIILESNQMIHVRVQQGISPLDAARVDIPPSDPCLHISLTTLKEIEEFQTVVNGYLNCRADFNKDWFELADKLEVFIANNHLKMKAG